MPGGHRTGAPGKHVVRGKAKYRLVDEQVRVFVAPPIEQIQNSTVRALYGLSWNMRPMECRLLAQLKAYVSTTVPVSRSFNEELYGKLPHGGLTGEHYFKIARRMRPSAVEAERINSP